MGDDLEASRAALARLRDILADREQRAGQWYRELLLQDGRELDDYEAQERATQLNLFLFEIAGDLSRWQERLGPILKEKP